MTAGRLLIAGMLLVLAAEARAGTDANCTRAGEPILCAYEPNGFGITQDSDGSDPFLDVNLSLRYQLFPTTLSTLTSGNLGEDVNFYLTMSVRFGQYLGSDSSPVIGKRFNPKLLMRKPLRSGRLDFAYAHESNGQSITSESEYQSALSSPKQAEFANDYISRGWDYLEMEWKHGYVPVDANDREKGLYWYFNGKYFLSDGLLQGPAEEYNDWEQDPEGKPRDQVNGVAVMVKHIRRDTWWKFSDAKLALKYETGYREMFKYNTFRFEAGTKLILVPLNLWVQHGYGNNLALYYKRMTSWGIEVQIGSF